MLDITTKGTIQEIALNLIEEQTKNQEHKNIGKEKTIFVLGSKGVGKSTLINNFLDRDEPTKPTLALEYSYCRRSGIGQDIQKQICNVWELGSLSNLHNLIDIPLRSHGLHNMHVIIVLDLAQPDRLWIDLEAALDGLKQSIKNTKNIDLNQLNEKMKSIIGREHMDIETLEIFPIPILIVGGNYDKFQNFDPEIKKHVCRCLRSITHTIGAALIYYSLKNTSLSKTVRDTFNHFGFGSPANPFRMTIVDYNEAIMIWYGKDSWNSIGVTPSNSERIGLTYSTRIPQMESNSGVEDNDPAKDIGFREMVIDEIRAQKDEELMRLIKDTEIRAKFQTVSN